MRDRPSWLGWWGRAGIAAAAALLAAGAMGSAPPPSGTAALDARLRLAASRHEAQPRAAVQPGMASGEASTASESSRVALFLEGDPDLAALDLLGVQLRTRVGAIWTAEAPLGAVGRLAQLPGLRRISLGAPVRTLLDSSLIAVNADSVRERDGDAWSGRTGRGVVVGIVDTGIDFTHEDFKRPDGSSRILYLWDQGDALGPPPDPGLLVGSYGTEWTAAQMEAGESTVRARDEDGHGTRVASAAAGNGRDSDLEERRYRYAGIAPEAELIVVALKRFASDADLVDAVSYIFERSERLGMPAVVNLSLGTHFGPHDGTGFLDRALDGLVGPGRLLVAAAGNDADDSLHAELDVPPLGSDSATVSLWAPAGVNLEILSIDAYCNRPDSLAVTVVAPSGARFGPYVLGDEVDPGLLTGEGTLALVYQNVDTVGTNLELLIDLSDYDPSQSGAAPPPAKGLWRVVFTDRAGAPGGGEVDLWIAQSYPASAQVRWRGHGYDPSEEVASPGTARGAITVGSFNSKRCWIDPLWQERCTTAPESVSQPGQITFFSSRGPTRDGRLKPELCAPGFVVATAYSRQMDPSLQAMGFGHTVDPDGRHAVFAGTSLSAPHLTGALALVLETIPQLSPEAAILRLRSSLLTDAHTGSGWSSAAGFGKLDVARLIDPDLVPVIERRFLIEAGEGGLPVLTWRATAEDPVIAFTLQSDGSRGDWTERARFPGAGPHRWQETSFAEEGTGYRLRAQLRGGETILWAQTRWSAGPQAPGLTLGMPAANPFRSGTDVPFRVEGAADLALRARVLDTGGRVVRSFGEVAARGSGTVRWDGRDDRGVRVPAGVYWMWVEAGPFRRSVKLIRLP